MAGYVGGIYFDPKDSLKILVVKNIKTWAAVSEYLKTHEHPFFERFTLVQEKKFVPSEIRNWVFHQFQKEGMRTPKSDKFGLLGGMILESEIKDYPDNYFDYAFAREFVEESGLMAVREEKTSSRTVRKSLFERIVLLEEIDRDNPQKQYENFFFWVKEADGELNKDGVDGETLAPVFMPIMSLTPAIFYPKHAEPLKILLRRLLKKGRKEYKEPLEYLKATFGMGYRGLMHVPQQEAPVLNLNDNDLWAQFTGQKGIKKLDKSR